MNSSPRDPNLKMVSYWDFLPPKLQEFILKKKTRPQYRDKMVSLVKEIGEFSLQPSPEDCHQGDSSSFFSRKPSHLSAACLGYPPDHQPAPQVQSRLVPVLEMWAVSPCGESPPLLLVQPSLLPWLWMDFVFMPQLRYIVNSYLKETKLVNITTCVYV